jgi:hypothetical protein
MKKKFRQITVDGDDSWAWNVKRTDDYYDTTVLVIWKDKNRVYEKCIRDNEYSIYKRYQMTPGLIARFIKTHLIKEPVS